MARLYDRGKTYLLAETKVLSLSNLEGRFHRRLSNVMMILLENWAVVDPRLKMFRLAFAIQSDKLRRIGQELNGALLEALPMEGRDGIIIDRLVPSTDLVAKVRSLEKKYSYESGLLDAYYSDLNVELQELLLGHLFGHRVERRGPPDPAQFTLRLDRYKQIMTALNATDFLKRGDQLDRELREFHRTKPRKALWRKLFALG